MRSILKPAHLDRPAGSGPRGTAEDLDRPGASDAGAAGALRRGEHVVEAKLAAGAEDPAHPASAADWLGTEQSTGCHRGVEEAVRERQAVGEGVDHPDRLPRLAGRLLGLGAQVASGSTATSSETASG